MPSGAQGDRDGEHGERDARDEQGGWSRRAAALQDGAHVVGGGDLVDGRIAEGHSNAAIARQLVVSEAAVGKHVGNIFAKLHLPQTDDTNRRVLAVLAYLRRDRPEP